MLSNAIRLVEVYSRLCTLYGKFKVLFMTKLCVNIDHIATVRQARRTIEPCPVEGALAAIRGGADGITLHLREDRRHIQDSDVFAINDAIDVPLNFEMAATTEMVQIATEVKPAMAMIVPEGRHEITTEGGLDVLSEKDHLTQVVQAIASEGVPVSAFVDADQEQIEVAKACGFTVCEIHTGPFAEAVIRHNLDLSHPEVILEKNRVADAVRFVHEIGLQCNAGHGLTHHNVGLIASIEGISELHIGHSIVSRAVMVGMQASVEQIKQQIKDAE